MLLSRALKTVWLATEQFCVCQPSYPARGTSLEGKTSPLDDEY